MTENRQSKRAIRSRMAQTGEKYTEARRALLPADDQDGSAGPVVRAVTLADEYLAEFGEHQHGWESEQAVADLAAVQAFPDELRDAELIRAAAQPVVSVVIKLAVLGFPGADLDTDAGWAAQLSVTRRELLTLKRAGIDAGLVDGHLRLINIIESRIGLWPEPEWTTAVRGHVQGLVQARDSGRERGLRSSSQATPTAGTDLAIGPWILRHLRHPSDHYFSMARVSMTDPALVAYLDQQIAAFAPGYAALSAGDWSSQETQAEIVVELQISEPTSFGWKDPVPATVVGIHRGSVPIGAHVGLRLVADQDAPFNGTLLSVLSKERWLVRGTLLNDGTLLPSNGTRRLTR
jgi:hypothetical protein